MKESELQTIDQSGLPVYADSMPVNPWVAILQQSVEKSADISQIEKFITLQREEEDRQAKRAYHSAMSRLQGMMPEISKNGTAKFKTKTGVTSYNFDRLNDICNALRGPLQSTGLSYGFSQEQTNGMLSVTCTVTHASGYSESNTISGPYDASGGKNVIQQVISTKSYLERATIKSAFGIASADDDGQASTKLANDKIGADNYAGWKARLDETLASKVTREELEEFKVKAVNYASDHEPAFCVEIYKKTEEIIKLKGW